MKALSIKQPFADQVYAGEKWLEFRSKPTSHRGELLICSSRSVTGHTIEHKGKSVPLPLGKMLVVVDLIDCRPTAAGDKKHPGAPTKIDGWWTWEFAEVATLVIPKPVIGRIGFFEVPDELIEPSAEGKYWFDYP